MKILIPVGYQYLGIDVGENAGPILAALENAQIYESTYSNGHTHYKPKGTKERPEPIKVEIVQDECFEDFTPMIDDLTNSLKASEGRWIEYYEKYNKAEKELKELQDKVAKLTQMVPGEPTKKPEPDDQVPF